MEMFDLYNNKGQQINKKIERGTNIPKGEYHLAVHIWFRNSEGKYLMQKRNKQTDRIPGQFAATGGAVASGEDSITGAIREVEEEMGLIIESSELKFLKRYFVDDSFASYITDVYLVEKDIDVDKLVLDKNEVSMVQYFTMDEIRKMIQQESCWSYEDSLERKGYLELIEKS